MVSYLLDSFSALLPAIEEGKSIFFNVKNFLRFQLSTSVAALLLIGTTATAGVTYTITAFSTFFGLPPPLNAMQILWINIIMDGPPAQSLGVEPVDREVMKRPPRPKNTPIVDADLLKRVFFSSTCIVVGTLLVYRSEMLDGKVTARDTTMTFTTFVMFDMFNAMSCRSERKSIFDIGLTANRPLVYSITGSLVTQLLVVYVPILQSVFQTEAIGFYDILRIICLSSSVLLLDEAYKWYLRRVASIAAKEKYQIVP